MSTDTIRAKIAKLLTTADSLGDSPAADAYRDRAFDLAAQYGVEASRKLPGQDDPGEMIEREYSFSGSYTDMQALLLRSLASALHCYPVQQNKYRSSAVSAVWVFGRRKHLERADMLYSILNPLMIAGAKNQPATAFPQSSETTRKRSFMRAYATKAYARLSKSESDWEGEYSHNGQSGAMALLNDRQQAESAAHDQFDGLRTRRQRQVKIDPAAYNAGLEAGSRADLGQDRVQNRPELTN